jgi:hypothetical protein
MQTTQRKTSSRAGATRLQENLLGRRDPDSIRSRPLEASNFWRDATDPRGTLVEQYLNSIGLDLPSGANEAIRFHPRVIYGFPGMLCLVRNILDNEPQAIHETAFSTNGTAVKRLTRGSTSGGAIKLDADEAVTQSLCIGVELEPCLAARQIGFAPVRHARRCSPWRRGYPGACSGFGGSMMIVSNVSRRTTFAGFSGFLVRTFDALFAPFCGGLPARSACTVE